MAQDPYKYFRPEARELVDQFAKGVLDLEKGRGGEDAVQRLLRVAHTLKGAARIVRQSEIADRAHAIEDVLASVREGGQSIPHGQIDALLEHLDAIGGRLGELTLPDDADRSIESKNVRDDAPRTVRADLAESDAVLNGVRETHALADRLRGSARDLEQAHKLAEVLQANLPRTSAREPSPHPHRINHRTPAILEELCSSLGSIGRNLLSTIDQMDRELRQLRQAAERLRLVAADSLFTGLELMARDAAHKLGKRVTFEGKGGGIRLDADVLETVRGALIQIVRNAVAHGIEPQAERKKAGKPVAGRISVEVRQRGRRIVFECRDDGRGVDIDAVRRVAEARGLTGPATRDPGGETLMRMLLRGGISTSPTITDASGRGVGLDVVRASVERLGGEVLLRTDLGLGTAVELALPSSLTSIEALVVGSTTNDGTVASARAAYRVRMPR